MRAINLAAIEKLRLVVTVNMPIQRPTVHAVAGAQREPLADPDTETWCPYATPRIAEALLVR
jgi:hypothetical protein